MQPLSTPLKVLSQEQAEAFLRDGFVIVRGAFRRETAEQLLPHVWARIEEDPEDRSTWTRSAAEIQEVILDGPSQDLFTDRYLASLDDLLGEGRWHCERGFGWVPIRFPGFRHGPWRAPTSGWHVDGINFHHHLDSPEQALVGIEMLTKIEPGGGGTALRVGSHRAIARLLRSFEPEGISYQQLRALSEELDDFPVVEAVGDVGDVLWMHPFLIHARSPNTRDTPRIASNRWVASKEPLRIDGEGERSLVEQAIVLGLAEA